MEPSRLLSNVTLVLVAMAAVLLQVALIDRQPILWPGWAQLVCAGLIAGYGARYGSRSSWAYGLAFGALTVLPLVCNAATRSLMRYGDPNEVLLAYMLRNLMLGLAASRTEARTQHFAGLASFFLVLFSFLWTMNLATVLLLAVYSLVGMWWLLGSYWDGIQGRFADRSEQAIPLKPAVTAIGVVLLLLLVALPVARSSRVTTALQGFFPSSGGSGWADEFAHGGVGDGDQMVAAKDNASSFGAVDSELFLESKMPSLYDVINELSEPTKINKKKGRQRAIPLASNAMKENHQRLGQNQQANREFNTVRKRSNKTQPSTRDHKSPALLQVRGRVPLHLGLHTYDLWDGRVLSSSGVGEQVFLTLDRDPVNGRNWLRLSRVLPESLFNHTEQHQVRIINLKTDRLPAPPNLTGVNLDHLHTASMFRFAEDGSMQIDAAMIPQLTVLNVESQRVARSSKPDLKRSDAAGQTSVSQTNKIAQLARTWTAGVEPGWPQIAAIRDRLRSEYTLDPDAVAPEDCDDSVEHFLLEARRGPDYLFATSAALLVRSLGYETRVRSGLYARPENYERLADLTPVNKEDAHFWIEVHSTNGVWFDRGQEQRPGSWILVEPSPGYEVLYAPETLLARWARSAAATARAVVANPLVSTLVTGLIAFVVWWRVPLLDHTITAWWRLAGGVGDSRRQVLATVRLLECRAWLRNQTRQPGTTLGRWRLHPGSVSPEAALAIQEFQRLAAWALYGEGVPAALPADRIRASCRDAARLALRTDDRQTQGLQIKSTNES